MFRFCSKRSLKESVRLIPDRCNQREATAQEPDQLEDILKLRW